MQQEVIDKLHKCRERAEFSDKKLLYTIAIILAEMLDEDTLADAHGKFSEASEIVLYTEANTVRDLEQLLKEIVS
jgi:hypothetical protein